MPHLQDHLLQPPGVPVGVFSLRLLRVPARHEERTLRHLYRHRHRRRHRGPLSGAQRNLHGRREKRISPAGARRTYPDHHLRRIRHLSAEKSRLIFSAHFFKKQFGRVLQ